jgi:UDP-N-acetylglucosamine/UDP-N-acetylgalactosamine diphosphorylase
VAAVHAKASNVDQLRERFQAQGQGHVFQHWDRLTAAERDGLVDQCMGLDLEALLRGRSVALEAHASEAAPQLEPVEAELLPERGGDPARREAARVRGEALLRDGRVGVMVVAGGQATRLGHPGPKGLFPLGPISHRTLFGQQAQKLRRLRERWGRPLPWYVMTSPATDVATRAGFAENDHFGLPAEDVMLFSQSMVPSFDFDGKLMLETPSRIFENPNGHGGAITALLDSGALDDMARRGIDTLFYYQVDNPLVPLADPVFLGFHTENDAEISCKVIRKRDADEKVGVVARVDGRVGVVEYTEIDEASRSATDAQGELRYWGGNTAIHIFNVEFIRRVAADPETLLPYHASAKKIPGLDPSGHPMTPEAPNGHKLERFIFDALRAAERVCVVEASREEEYSPVKNASGSDSPTTARTDLQTRYRAWLEEAGVALPPDLRIEIDESVIADAADVRNMKIRRVEDAPDAIRTAPGVEA